LTVLVSDDEGLNKYIKGVMGGIEEWLREGTVERLVVVVGGLDSGETLERWNFDVKVEGDDEGLVGGGENGRVTRTQRPENVGVGNESHKSECLRTRRICRRP